MYRGMLTTKCQRSFVPLLICEPESRLGCVSALDQHKGAFDFLTVFSKTPDRLLWDLLAR